ncbi:MAG: sarcosine oxidase subunit gamma family protein [Betaproteobacteria bacterium]
MSELEVTAGSVGSTEPGHYGIAASAVTLQRVAISTAWNVQGDPARDSFVDEARRAFNVTLPTAANTTARGEAWHTIWLGPKAWQLIARRDAPSDMATLAARRDAMNAAGGALFDVSASRIAFAVGGAQAAAVLAKSCALDFHTRALPIGHCAQSVLGHVNALIVHAETESTFTVMVARSFARDGWRTLCVSAAQYGYDVLPTAAYR